MNEPKSIKSVHITKDVWFYPVKSKLLFTVYVEGKPLLFDITKKKLKKYL